MNEEDTLVAFLPILADFELFSFTDLLTAGRKPGSPSVE